jgi:hypothetical protein
MGNAWLSNLNSLDFGDTIECGCEAQEGATATAVTFASSETLEGESKVGLSL